MYIHPRCLMSLNDETALHSNNYRLVFKGVCLIRSDSRITYNSIEKNNMNLCCLSTNWWAIKNMNVHKRSHHGGCSDYGISHLHLVHVLTFWCMCNMDIKIINYKKNNPGFSAAPLFSTVVNYNLFCCYDWFALFWWFRYLQKCLKKLTILATFGGVLCLKFDTCGFRCSIKVSFALLTCKMAFTFVTLTMWNWSYNKVCGTFTSAAAQPPTM
jgi:hypothetical protein